MPNCVLIDSADRRKVLMLQNETKGRTPPLQSRDEFVRRYVGLTQDTCQRACLDFAVHWNEAFGTTAHDDVASGLAKLLKPQVLQRPNYGRPRNVRQFRHAPER